MKKMSYEVSGVIMFAMLLFLLPSKSATAQKLISETLQSKTLVEEDDGFKWYRYTYEYWVKCKGKKVFFTRESAYNDKGKLLIDGRFKINWISSDLSRIKKCYWGLRRRMMKSYPSEIEEQYSLFLEYEPSIGLFTAKTPESINSDNCLAVFTKEGSCLLFGVSIEKNGIISGRKLDYIDGGNQWVAGKVKYNEYSSCGVVKNGKIIVPLEYNHDLGIKIENGLYFARKYSWSRYSSNDYTAYCDVYNSSGSFIGRVGESRGSADLSKEFFDGPNGQKWLIISNDSYSKTNYTGFFYCINSGKKIDVGNGSSNRSYENIEGYLFLAGNLYTGDGDQITNYGNETSLKLLVNDGSSDIFLVAKDYKHKGLVKIEGNKTTELIACEYGEIRCLNTDDGGDLFEVTKPYSPYDVGVIKVEGNRTKKVLDCSFTGGGRMESCGLYNYIKEGTDYYQNVVFDNYGSIIIPYNKNYFHLQFSEEKNVFEGYKQLGKTVYNVTLDLNGKELSCKKSYEINPQQSKQETKPQQPKQETKTTSTPQPQPQPQPVRQPQPFQVWEACFLCGGSGQCRYCNGFGWAANGKDDCGICHGTGKCSECAGHGGKNVIVYR